MFVISLLSIKYTLSMLQISVPAVERSSLRKSTHTSRLKTATPAKPNGPERSNTQKSPSTTRNGDAHAHVFGKSEKYAKTGDEKLVRSKGEATKLLKLCEQLSMASAKR